MVRPLMLLSPSESRDRAGPITPTLGGPAAVVGGSWFVEEGTTNLFTNPSAETDLTNIVAASVGITISRVATGATSGSFAAQVVCAGAGAGEAIQWQTATGLAGAASSSVAAQIDFTTSVSQAMNFRLRFFYTDATNAFQVIHALTPAIGTTHIEIPVAVSDAAKTLDRVAIHIGPASTAAITFQVDSAQVEFKAYHTSYADGSLGTGYTWAGTAHASASTRAAGTVSAPLDGFELMYIRHDDGESSVLTGPGAFGDHGLVVHAGGSLSLQTTRTSEYEKALAYPRALTESELELLNSLETSEIGWDTLNLVGAEPQVVTPAETVARQEAARWRMQMLRMI